MSDRRAQIIRLLETRDDNLPTPTRREHSISGFVNEASPRSCPDCLSNGRVMKTCETCGGSGTVGVKRLDQVALPDVLPSDGSTTDPYAESKVQPYGLDLTRHDRSRERDAAIDRLAAQTREPWASPEDELADANAHAEGWELARRRMYQTFDYGPLDAALELLRDLDVTACSVIHSLAQKIITRVIDGRPVQASELAAIYILGWTEPTSTVEAILDRGLVFIDERMPDPIRSPGDEPQVKLATGRVARAAGRDALAERDAEIQRAILEAGIPTGDVARTWGITTRQVNRIVARAAEAA